MIKYVQNLVEERELITETAFAIAQSAADEGRDLTDDEEARIAAGQERCAAIDTQLEVHSGQLDSARQFSRIAAKITDRGDDMPVARARAAGGNGHGLEARTWGQTFVESDAFRSYGGAGSSARVAMPAGLLEERQANAADPIMVGDLGKLVAPYRHEPAVPTWQRPLLTEINREPVGVGSVEYFYFEPAEPNAAPEVAEGAVKPPMELTLVEKSAALKTYAHWKAITRQALEDFARIRAIIEGYLREGLARSVEEAVAGAIGAETNIPAGPGGADALTAIRSAMATVQTNGFTPTTVLVNPADWASIDVQVMGLAVQLPGVGSSYWGLRVVSSRNVPAGTAYVGDFRQGITLFDRNVTNVFITDSHIDFFLRNQLVILAETRALPVVTAPTALVKVTFAAGGGAEPATARAGGGGARQQA